MKPSTRSEVNFHARMRIFPLRDPLLRRALLLVLLVRLLLGLRCAAVMAAGRFRGLVDVRVPVDVRRFAPAQNIVVHRGVEQADEPMPARPQLVQRRGKAPEPRKHLLGDRGVHVVDTMAYAQLQISSRVALTPKQWTGRYEVPVYGAKPDTP